MPTLNEKGTFEFDTNVKQTSVPKQIQDSVKQDRAIDTIIKIVRSKLSKTGLRNKVYFLQGRCGSGKSTMLIQELYNAFIRGKEGCIFCTEPRVVLAKSNAAEVEKYSDLTLGTQIGYITGEESLKCTNEDHITYCTTQVLTSQLLTAMSKSRDKTLEVLKKFKIIVIDEVHTYDDAIYMVLKVVKSLLLKYSNEFQCPLFIFTSATINIDELMRYYFDLSVFESEIFKGHVIADDGEGGGENEISLYQRVVSKENVVSSKTLEYDDKAYMKFINNIYSDWQMIGYVKGESNYEANEIFLNESDVKKYNVGAIGKSIATYFYKEWFNHLFTREIRFENKEDGMLCRDVLIFVPTTKLMVECADTLSEFIGQKLKQESVKTNKTQQPSRKYKSFKEQSQGKKNNKMLKSLTGGYTMPILIIEKGMSVRTLQHWREKHAEDKRIVIVLYGRNFSTAADYIINNKVTDDYNCITNEIRIIISTPVIETGKTIDTISLCIDSGLEQTNITNPFNKSIYSKLNENSASNERKTLGTVVNPNPNNSLKVVPISKNQTIQRLGRIGRKAPGTYVHFYTKSVYETFQDIEISSFINTSSIVEIMYNQLMNTSAENIAFNVHDENNYIVKVNPFIIKRTIEDLVNSGAINTYSQVIDVSNILTSKVPHDILIAQHLHLIRGFTLYDALLCASLFKYRLLNYIDMSILDVDNMRAVLKDIYSSNDMSDVICKCLIEARNNVRNILCGEIADFIVNEDKIW